MAVPKFPISLVNVLWQFILFCIQCLTQTWISLMHKKPSVKSMKCRLCPQLWNQQRKTNETLNLAMDKCPFGALFLLFLFKPMHYNASGRK